MRSILGVLLLLPLTGVCQPPPGYYDAAGGLSGPPLRAALYEIINGHSVLDYSNLWQAFGLTDRKPDDTVWDIYSDVPGGTPAYTFSFVVDQCGTYQGEGDCFNREHTFPQSWYNDLPPMNSDLFHVYPTDAWVNQQRGNLAFGTVGSVNWTSTNGGKRGSCNWPGCSGTVFEPINAYKGDIARSYFYMLTRYLPQAPNWTSPMLSGGEFLPWVESMLLAWHELDPVSPKEVQRNNTIYLLQGNRNPYIDRPDLVPAIWGPFASVEEQAALDHRLWVHDGTMVVEWTSSSTAQLMVLDAAGRSVLQQSLQGPRSELQLDLAPGVYVALLGDGSQRTAVRFVH
jgi:endonuclease I